MPTVEELAEECGEKPWPGLESDGRGFESAAGDQSRDQSRNCRESKLGLMRDRLPPCIVVVVGVEVAVAVGVGVAPPG